MECPHCGKTIKDDLVSFAYHSMFGKMTSEKKAESCRRNGKLGGRPKGSKNASK